MLDALREAFRQAIENFKTEMDRDRIPEAADRLLRAMREELVEVKRLSQELAADLEATREEAARERTAAETCLRRERMALDIDDDHTAGVAREFAEKHLRRHEILSQKAEVVARELADRQADLSEMRARFEEARLRRQSLAATAGRTDSREQIRKADELFEEMDRMAKRIRDLEGRAAAAREIGETLGDIQDSSDPAVDLEARLEALKRRMGKR